MLIISNKYESLDRILDGRSINEGTFGSGNFIKHSHKDDVISNIINNEEILLGSNGESSVVLGTLLNKEEKEALKKVQSIEEFNSILSSNENVRKALNLRKSDSNIWTKLYKGAFSGYAGGQTNISTADQENITCRLFELMLNEDSSVPDIDTIKAIAKEYAKKELSDSWAISFLYQCKQLANTKNIASLNNLKKKKGNIIVCRTTDLKKNGLDNVMRAQLILANNNSVSTAAIDSSDIYCIANPSSANKFLGNAIDRGSDSKIVNAFHKLFNSGNLVGISLKKVTRDNGVIIQPRNEHNEIPEVINCKYAQRVSKGISLMWLCDMNNGDRSVFNLRDNGQGTIRFELVSSSGQRIGDVPVGLWRNTDRKESLYNLLNIDSSKPLTLQTIADYCDNKHSWNDDTTISAFNTYYKYAAKISSISLDHLLSM